MTVHSTDQMPQTVLDWIGLGKWFAITGALVCVLILATDLTAYLLRERRRRGREAVWARRDAWEESLSLIKPWPRIDEDELPYRPVEQRATWPSEGGVE